MYLWLSISCYFYLRNFFSTIIVCGIAIMILSEMFVFISMAERRQRGQIVIRATAV